MTDKTAYRLFWAILLLILLVLALIAGAIDSHAQTSVALAPAPRLQFTYASTGLPLSLGCVFTYQAGTTTPLATYADGSNSPATNTNPVLLDAAGMPTASGSPVGIWLGPQKYKIVVTSAGGTACASGSQQYVMDNVYGPNLALVGSISLTAQAAPTCNAGQYFLWADTSALRVKMCNNGVIDSVVGANTADTLSNKTLNNATINASTLSVKTLNNNICFADQYSGADASIKTNACIADVIAGHCGTCDARALFGAQTVSQEVDCGNAAQFPVDLLLPFNATWTTSITNGTSCAIKAFSGCSLNARGPSSVSMKVVAGSSGNLDSLLCTDGSPAGGGSYIRVDGLTLYNPNGATLVNGAANIHKLYDNSDFYNVTIANYSGIGLNLHDVCCQNNWYALTVNGNSSSGARPIVIGNTTENTSDVNFFGLSAGHPGAGLNVISVPSNTTFTQNLSIYGLYMEPNASDTTTPLVDLKGAGPFIISGLKTGLGALGSTAYAIQVESGFDVRGVNFTAINPQYGFAVNDLVKGTTVSGVAFEPVNYSWMNGQNISSFSGLSFWNNADASAQVPLRAGVSADQSLSLTWQDKSGNIKWNWQKLSDNRFQLLDGASMRMLFTVGGSTQYNIASGSHLFQVASSTVASIDSSGNGVFNGNMTIGGGGQTVVRCLTAGTLPIGALTVNSGACGTSSDTGLRTK